ANRLRSTVERGDPSPLRQRIPHELSLPGSGRATAGPCPAAGAGQWKPCSRTTAKRAGARAGAPAQGAPARAPARHLALRTCERLSNGGWPTSRDRPVDKQADAWYSGSSCSPGVSGRGKEDLVKRWACIGCSALLLSAPVVYGEAPADETA